MSKDDINDIVDRILNPSSTVSPITEKENKIWGEFSLNQEVLSEGSIIIDGDIVEINIVDLKGRHFRFPGTFKMKREGNKVSFKAFQY